MAIVENTNPRIQYQGPTDIGAVLFIDFPYNKKADVKCWIDEEPLQYNVDYTIEESNVTLNIPVEVGKLITLFRDTPLDQQGSFPQNSRFNSQELDSALDKLCMQQQEQAEAINRSMKASIIAMNFNGSIPAPKPGRALKINDEGTGFALSDFDPDEAMTITEDFKKAAEDAANYSESIKKEVEQIVSEIDQQVVKVEDLVRQGEENVDEVIKQGSELIQLGQQIQRDIIDTGIDTRATLDLDNITDEAKQGIQYQAKLANAPFCANSGNIGGSKTKIYFEPWTRPTATGTTTLLPEGNMTITASASSDTAWKAFNNAYASSTSDGWRPMATGQQWWKVIFPYKIKITGLVYRNACSDESSSITGRFYTSDTMETPIGDEFTSPSNNAGSVTITNIPEKGVLTDTIYLQKTAGNKYGGLGELEITAEKEVSITLIGGDAELLYIPNTNFVEITHDIDLNQSNNQTNITPDGYFQIETVINTYGPFGDFTYMLTEPLTRVISITHNAQKATNANYNSLGLQAWAILEDGSQIELFSIAQGLYGGSSQGTTDFTDLPTVKGIRIYTPISRGNNANWSPSCFCSFSVTKEIKVTQGTECHFKIGHNYPKLVATNTEKTFEKDYLPPVVVSTESYFMYEPNYVTVGTLLDNGGIITGFDTSNYITIPKTFLPNGKAWGCVAKVRTSDDITTQQCIFSLGWNASTGSKKYGSQWGIRNATLFYQFGNGSNTVTSYEAGTVEPNTDYWIKVEFTGSEYKLYLSTTGIFEEPIHSFASTTNFITSDIRPTMGNTCFDNTWVQAWLGSIDLKETYINFDGLAWWQCLKKVNVDEDGTYNIFVSDQGNTYKLTNTIYRQKTSPVSKFVQPILIRNGIMGGDSFAVSSNVEYAENYACRAFDGIKDDTSYFHTPQNVKTGYYDIYNPIALNITHIKFYNQIVAANRASSAGNIYGSNNGEEWTLIKNYTNTVQAKASTWEIDLSSNEDYYKYYRIESTAGSSDQYWVIVEMEITATEEIPPVDTVWLNTSSQPYKAYKFNGTTWEDFNDVPIGSIVVEDGIITSVETLPYNNAEVSKPSHSRPAVVVETYQKDASWCRVYSDDWCEQGGFGGGVTATTEIYLLKPYRDENYHINAMTMSNVNSKFVACAVTTESGGYTKDKFKILQAYNGGTGINTFVWEAKGYIR